MRAAQAVAAAGAAACAVLAAAWGAADAPARTHAAALEFGPDGVTCPLAARLTSSYVYSNLSVGSPRPVNPSIAASGTSILAVYGWQTQSQDLFVGFSQDGGASYSKGRFPALAPSGFSRVKLATNGATYMGFFEAQLTTGNVGVYSATFSPSSLTFSGLQLVMPYSVARAFDVAASPSLFTFAYVGYDAALVIKSLNAASSLLSTPTWVVRYDPNSAGFNYVSVTGGVSVATDGTGFMVCAVSANVTCMASPDGLQTYAPVLTFPSADSTFGVGVGSNGAAGVFLVAASEYDAVNGPVVSSRLTFNFGASWSSPITAVSALSSLPLAPVSGSAFQLIVYKVKPPKPVGTFSPTSAPPPPGVTSYLRIVAEFIYTRANDSLPYSYNLESSNGTLAGRLLWSADGTRFAGSSAVQFAVANPALGPVLADGIAVVTVNSLYQLASFACLQVISAAPLLRASGLALWAVAVGALLLGGRV